MTQEASNPKESLSLKLPELEVSADEPWGDDVLGRAEIAGRLTNLIRDQSAPFTISIHGYWGTGKTFMLKRWQQDLENQDFQAIYFNAWEDDFCDDPLLAIIGQLAEHFNKDESTFKSLAANVGKKGVLLLKQNALGLVEKHTGITFELKQDETDQWDPLKEYLSQRATKDELKEELKKLSSKVRGETGHPLVFIIDELDRCRPTFAIELLERVKHIFDVPDLVFVFGVNRDELCKSLASVYGEIDVDVYLRRFFDMELTLPEVDSAEFAWHLMTRFKLDDFFSGLSAKARNRIHQSEYRVLATYFPRIWSGLSLSLRDIDYCVRLIALTGKNMELHNYMYPWLIGLLITVKIKNLNLYRRFIGGFCYGSEVVDFVDSVLHSSELDDDLARFSERIEAELYMAQQRVGSSSPLAQLRLLQQEEPLTHPYYLSQRTRASGSERAGALIRIIEAPRESYFPFPSVASLARMIDLHQEMVRR